MLSQKKILGQMTWVSATYLGACAQAPSGPVCRNTRGREQHASCRGWDIFRQGSGNISTRETQPRNIFS